MTPADLPSIEPELLIATLAADGRVRDRNGAWTKILGAEPDVWAALETADAEAAHELVREAGRGVLATRQLFLVPPRKGGDARPLLMNFFPVQGEGGEVESVLVTGEVLEQPESWTVNHTERNRMETLGRMTMGIAHDFNNLLSGIIGHAELMRGALTRVLDREVLSEHVRTIERAANDGGALINKIQRYIRQEKEASFVPLDLPVLIQDCIVLTRPYWYNEPRRQGIAIAVEQRLEHVPLVAGSAAELRDVLVNLILNAVQAMPEGGLITFRTWHRDDSVYVSVRDTGTGMTAAVRDRIFEPLFTTKGDRGTGMGLAVTHGVIQEHGGRLEVESTVGAGTTFTVVFPTSGKSAARPAGPAAEKPGRPLRILIVDDEAMVRTVLRKLLGLRGHDVVDAGSGAEGLELLGQSDFDVVITDQGMPEMSGRAFAAEIAGKHPGMPVLLLTGDTHAGSPDDTIAAVLAKPFRIDDIEMALSRHVP